MDITKDNEVSSTLNVKNNVTMNTANSTNNLSNHIDGQIPNVIRVIRRNNSVTNYDDNKIAVAMSKAFLAVEGNNAAASSRIHDLVTKLTTDITKAFRRRLPTGGIIHIEDIQDQVELALMRSGEHKVARSYVLYREEQSKARKENLTANKDLTHNIKVTLPNGEQGNLPVDHLKALITEACSGLKEVDAKLIFDATVKNIFDGVPLKDVYKAMIMSARPLIEQEPNYSFVTARLLMHECRTETVTYFGHQGDITQAQMAELYPQVFKQYIARGIEIKRLDEKLLSFDLEKLGQAIKANASRDLQFTYLGLQTLYDRYFIHDGGNRIELPQTFFMRVAMGLAISEDPKEKNDRAIEFYNILSSFDFMSSTPTLFNSGTIRSQLSSCYLTTVPDDLAGIYNAIKDNALLSKYAGGLGNDWTPVRGLNAHIEGTNGKSQGVVPFLKVANDTAVAVNQGGKRKGAVCAYMETWHVDIEEFLELRKNTGDDRRRTHDMNTANWIPDLFMKRVYAKEDWTLFSPDEVIDLHDTFGKDFEQKYLAYENLAQTGKIRNFKKVSAVSLWRKMLGLLFETGHPWITFKDPCNIRSPQQHVGVVHSSNLCTEITLNTSIDEIAVCNLGSVNLIQHIDPITNQLDKKKLEKTIKTAIRMLDNVIDINFYSVPQAKTSNLRHRPIGMGIMGFQDVLYKLNIPYGSQQAVDFADESMEYISYYAISSSVDLAAERGSYETYPGSLWSQGILPIDSIKLLKQHRGGYVDLDESFTLDWESLRQKVKTIGMRNSNTMAIAPTATISNICGVSQSIEPTYQNLFVKSNLSGEFTVINPYLVADLKALNLWDNVMVNDLKYFNGSVVNIDRIPQHLKDKYKTAFEIEPEYLIDSAARRQKWIDQGQSLNLYMAQASGPKLDKMYKHAWVRGLKTTYYLRSLGATNAEKSTVNDTSLNAVKVTTTTTAPLACSIDNPDCEACQ